MIIRNNTPYGLKSRYMKDSSVFTNKIFADSYPLFILNEYLHYFSTVRGNLLADSQFRKANAGRPFVVPGDLADDQKNVYFCNVRQWGCFGFDSIDVGQQACRALRGGPYKLTLAKFSCQQQLRTRCLIRLSQLA